VADDQGNNDKFYIHEKSVLADLLAAQRVDTVGIVQAHNHFKQLPPKSQVVKSILNYRIPSKYFSTKSHIGSKFS
jgi:hypothetical protein